MPYSAVAIANFFIKKGLDEKVPLSNMKVQKLVYFAHAIYSASYDKLLVGEPFVAWPHGPVVVSLHQELEIYEEKPITSQIFSLDVEKSSVVCKPEEVPSFDTETIKFLELTWQKLSPYTAWQLRELSHDRGGAWFHTVDDYFKRLNLGRKEQNKKEIDINNFQDLYNNLPRNLTILDEDIKECGR